MRQPVERPRSSQPPRRPAILLDHTAADAEPLANIKLIVLSDGKPEHDRQSRAVAAALGVPEPEMVPLAMPRRGLAAWLPVPWTYRGPAQVPTADLVLTTGPRAG